MVCRHFVTFVHINMPGEHPTKRGPPLSKFAINCQLLITLVKHLNLKGYSDI